MAICDTLSLKWDTTLTLLLLRWHVRRKSTVALTAEERRLSPERMSKRTRRSERSTNDRRSIEIISDSPTAIICMSPNPQSVARLRAEDSHRNRSVKVCRRCGRTASRRRLWLRSSIDGSQRWKCPTRAGYLSKNCTSMLAVCGSISAKNLKRSRPNKSGRDLHGEINLALYFQQLAYPSVKTLCVG